MPARKTAHKPANKHRGEATITLGESSYVLRPTFTALVEIEDRTGMGLIELAQAFFDQKVKVRDVVAVIFAGIKAGNNDWPDEDAVAQAVVAGGIANVIEPVGAFLADALAGGQTPDDANGSAAGNGSPSGAKPGSGRKTATTPSAPSRN